jgi:hypothetical protein
MKKLKTIILLFFGVLFIMNSLSAQTSNGFRPPAVPLVTTDPYFSVWAINDQLSMDRTRHWTGSNQCLSSLIRIDGKSYKIMGRIYNDIPTLKQTDYVVYPTRTIYTFQDAGIKLLLTFLTPALSNDLDNVSKPVTYITWEVVSTDNTEHDIKVYFENTAELVINTSPQKVTWGRYNNDKINILRMGSKDQPILDKFGDDLRIDWGFLYLCSEKNSRTQNVFESFGNARAEFVDKGELPVNDDLNNPRSANDNWPIMAHVYDFGKVGSKAASHYILLAYDDIFSIQYFYRNLKGYWTKKYGDIQTLITKSFEEYEELNEKCKKFDEEILGDLNKIGGEKYSLISALAYRQCLAANKIAIDIDGSPLMFPKENFSNGCIATVDVIYPASPFFLLFNPKMLAAQIAPIMDYSVTKRWKFPFAPHDLGTYPHANGQVYGGGEKTEEDQMPVEETGNMLIMIAALAKIDNNLNFANKYWDIIARWADYLKQKGFDPENQLCTDDFAGHLAHNVNLSAKAIVGLGAYSKLCEMAGKKAEAKTYYKLAKEYADKWIQLADDGDHYKLAFDKPGTWSQKYNLIWDKLLGLNLFPKAVYEKEIKYYLTKQNEFGLPLDNRKEYTKFDWIIWTASLSDKKDEFEKFVNPLFDFCNKTPDRVPLTDWFWTKDAKKVGFQARSVIGGVFIKMLTDPIMWEKWSKK